MLWLTWAGLAGMTLLWSLLYRELRARRHLEERFQNLAAKLGQVVAADSPHRPPRGWRKVAQDHALRLEAVERAACTGQLPDSVEKRIRAVELELLKQQSFRKPNLMG